MEEIQNYRFCKEPDGKSSLVFGKNGETFEEKMLLLASPKGILPLIGLSEKEYRYDVTGRKTLSVTFERVPMNTLQITRIVGGILDIVTNAKEYLLEEEDFVLRSDLIFLGFPDYEVTLCHVPGYGVPFWQQLSKLFEVFLNRVDYREEKAIAMVYGLYMQLQEPDMTMSLLRTKLSEYEGEERPQPESMRLSEVLPSKIRKEQKRQEEEKTAWTDYRGSNTEEAKETKAGKTTAGKKEHKKSFLDMMFRKENEKTIPKEKKKADIKDREKRQTEREELFVSPYMVAETPPEWGTQYTRVLSFSEKNTQPYLVSEKDGRRIFLEKFPFFIGSLPGYVDFVIPKDTVSRFHAKLLREEDTIKIADLNSTNGTRVNSGLLAPQEERCLADGDRLEFAGEPYRYCEK